MTAQYHFIVSCKRITKAKWVMEMRSEQGDIPMSIVHPDANVTGVLTMDAITQDISEPSIMTRYLRQLTRRTGARSGGHNDAVIWNISQRFPQLRIGQQLAVRISYIEHRALSDMRCCTYEIKSLGIFPRIFQKQESRYHATPQSSYPSQSEIGTHVHTLLKETPSTTPDPLTEQSAQIPQIVIDTMAHLVNYVENLQQQLLIAQNTSNGHSVLLRVVEERMKAMEKRIQQLEAENYKLKKMIHEVQPTSLRAAHPHAQESLQPSETDSL